MKTYEEVEVKIHVFLTSPIDEGLWSTSRSGHFTPGKSLSIILRKEVRWV
jgi:hypothetical protein